MNNYDANDPHCRFVQCIVCGKAITSGKWFARRKHDEWTIAVCSPLCEEFFDANPHLYMGRIQTLKLEIPATMFGPDVSSGGDDAQETNPAMWATAKESHDLPKNVESSVAR